MGEGRADDWVTLESERTGHAAREGEILQQLGSGEGVHCRPSGRRPPRVIGTMNLDQVHTGHSVDGQG